ncbi:hypothetical protein IPM65_02415 [Candidatus Roizmanbacteria bacterium]|nr:MAG: hypothetical protein IPM65_02415 [Candidatus Roizmanbacteria bacterium]
MKNSVIILNTAAIYIAIDLSRIADPDILKALSDQISTFYKMEIVRNFKKKPDFTIYYVADEEYRFVKQQIRKGTSINYFLETFSIGEDSAKIHYHVSIAQFQFFLKLILQSILGSRKGFILHSSGITDDQHAFLFLGPNGIGKSTIVDNLSQKYRPYADDMVIVRKIEREWYAFQLPLEKKRYKKIPDSKMPIRALFYLSQSKKTKLQKISSTEASKKLLDQLIRNGLTKKNITYLFEFLAFVDHYILETPKKTAIKTIEGLVSSYQ